MPYTINKTDGTVIATIQDGNIDNTTSLTLFGKSRSNFGELLNENQIKLLENSAGTSAPTAPLRGELWFDTNTGQLKVYDGSAFEPAGGANSSAGQPTSPTAGDLWHETGTDQVYVYTGSAWHLIGPVYTSGQTSNIRFLLSSTCCHDCPLRKYSPRLPMPSNEAPILTDSNLFQISITSNFLNVICEKFVLYFNLT